MKRVGCLLFLVFISPSFASPPREVEFGGKTYQLAFSAEPKAGEALQSLREYVPPGETLENWSSMVSRYEFTGTPAADLAARMKQQMESQGTKVRATTQGGSDGRKEHFLEFTLAKPEDGKLVVERNLWRIFSSEEGDAVGMQFAMRTKVEVVPLNGARG